MLINVVFNIVVLRSGKKRLRSPSPSMNSAGRYNITLTLKMTTAQVVETSLSPTVLFRTTLTRTITLDQLQHDTAVKLTSLVFSVMFAPVCVNGFGAILKRFKRLRLKLQNVQNVSKSTQAEVT